MLERSAEQLHDLRVHLAGVNRPQAAEELARLERLYLDVVREIRNASMPSRVRCDGFRADSRFAVFRNNKTLGPLACGLASFATRVIRRKTHVNPGSGGGSLSSLLPRRRLERHRWLLVLTGILGFSLCSGDAS